MVCRSLGLAPCLWTFTCPLRRTLGLQACGHQPLQPVPAAESLVVISAAQDRAPLLEVFVASHFSRSPTHTC